VLPVNSRCCCPWSPAPVGRACLPSAAATGVCVAGVVRNLGTTPEWVNCLAGGCSWVGGVCLGGWLPVVGFPCGSLQLW
jgi:hypothetical protein